MKIDQKQRHDLMGNEKDNTIPEHEYGKLNIHDFFFKKKERKKEWRNVEEVWLHYMGFWLGQRIYWCIGFHMEKPTVAVSSLCLCCSWKRKRKRKRRTRQKRKPCCNSKRVVWSLPVLSNEVSCPRTLPSFMGHYRVLWDISFGLSD